MVTTLAERLAAFFTSIKDGRIIKDRAAQLEAVRAARRVRSKDYIFDFDLHGANDRSREVVTTAAGWFFIMTGAAVHFEDLTPAQFPRVAVKFPMFCPDTPFDTENGFLEAVPGGLVFGREGAAGLHFEEYKNLFYPLGDTFTVAAEALNDTSINDMRGALVITGVEIDVKPWGL